MEENDVISAKELKAQGWTMGIDFGCCYSFTKGDTIILWKLVGELVILVLKR